MAAPSAQQFFEAEGKSSLEAHEDYMDFSERYADFIVEFEKKEGDLKRVERWPGNKIERRM